MNYTWESTIYTGNDPRQIALARYVQEVHNAVDILRDWVDLNPFHWDEGNGKIIEKGPELLVNPHFKEEHTDWGFMSKKSWDSEEDEPGLAYGWYIRDNSPPGTPAIYTVSQEEEENHDPFFCATDILAENRSDYDNEDVFHEGFSQKVRVYYSSYWLNLYSNPFNIVKDEWYLIQFFMKVLYGSVNNVEIVYPNRSHRQSLQQDIDYTSWRYYRYLMKADETDQQAYIQFTNESYNQTQYLLDTVRVKRWNIPRITDELSDPEHTFSRGDSMGEGPGEDKEGPYLVEEQCDSYESCSPYDTEDRDFYTYSQVYDLEGLPNHNEIYEIREVLESLLDNNKCQSHCYANYEVYESENYIDCGCDEADCEIY